MEKKLRTNVTLGRTDFLVLPLIILEYLIVFNSNHQKRNKSKQKNQIYCFFCFDSNLFCDILFREVCASSALDI